MKPIFKLKLLLPLICLMTGCWDRTEINDLSLITAMAFDKGKNQLISVTAQIVIPQNQASGGMGGGPGGGGSSRRTVTRTAEGYDVTDALSKLQRLIPRKQFLGQCTIFVFSEDVAKAGIQEHFDFMVRHPQPRERAYVFVSKGKAMDALDLLPPIENNSGTVLRKLSEMDIGMKVTLEELSMMLKGEAHAAALPLIYILPEGKSLQPYQTIPYVYGTAVFKKDKMVGEISEMTTRGVMWIRNEIKQYTVTFKTEEQAGWVSLQPVKAKVELIPKISGKQWSVTIKVRTEGDMVQNGTRINPMNPELRDKLDEAFKQAVKHRIELALNRVQHQLKADIFEFGKQFHRKYPKQWEQAKDRWEELFPQVLVQVDIDAHILGAGFINAPGGMPKSEVRNK